MSGAPIRLLFAISQFGQGGSERYLYELCAAIDRSKFDVHVLTRTDTDASQFYGSRLAQLGIPLHSLRPHVPDLRSYAPAIARRRLYRTARHFLASNLAWRRAGSLINTFDVIACIQIENFLELQPPPSGLRRFVVHAMSNVFQYGYDPYDEFSGNADYRFVTFDASQTDEVRRIGRASVFEWPLSMNFSGFPVVGVLDGGAGPLKIGIFTRLSREKPLEPLLQSFKALSERAPATLHVYGGGDPAIFASEISRLGIADWVIFEGHRRDIVATIAAEGLSMCWLMSVDTLLGYASIELAACGMPMVFWNFGRWDTRRIRDATGGAVQSFNSVGAFVDFCEWCARDRARLVDLGAALRRHVLSRHDISRNIGRLEDYYVRVVEENRSVSTADRHDRTA